MYVVSPFGYQLPGVVYGVDSLFSYYANGCSFGDGGLIISSGHQFTQIIPVINGKPALEHCKRIAYGGQIASDHLLKLLQMKYPSFPVKVTSAQALTMVRQHSYTALDYQEEMRALTDPVKFDFIDRVIQFPFVEKVDEQEDLEEAERVAERRREQGRRLAERTAQMREEKLREKEAYAAELTRIRDIGIKEDLPWAQLAEQLRPIGIRSQAEFESEIKNAEAAIKRIRNKMEGIEDGEEKEKPSFPLVDVPDEELDEEGKKEKRRQRLMKAGFDARERMKREKEEEKVREAERSKEEEERRARDPAKWLESIRERRQELVEKIRARQRKKAQLSDRRSHASLLRMKNIAALAAEEAPNKRRRRGQDDDTFGANDDDWGVYREIRRDDDDDSDEEEESASLQKLDELLIIHDPSFIPEDVYDETRSFRNTILHRLAYGSGAWDPSDPATMSQVHLNIERFRVPEAVFQPGIVGLDQAGLLECVTEILKRFDEGQTERMCKNILITGGNTLYTNLTQRIENDIRSIRPFGSVIRVRQAQNPILDAWKGAAKWAVEDESAFRKAVVTREMYEEFGHEYLVEHPMSNLGVGRG
ncbi:Nuclear actin-protein involved in chromatin remodeling [Rhizophlyctis rosea]|nr:Nuclear actin-protein involved in chromatin remodeling [Rhizophlyctis rosea]